MTWVLLVLVVLGLFLAVLGLLWRRAEVARHAGELRARQQAMVEGSHQARLQYPHVDLARCIGCGSCIAACPEDQVLALIHGQAMVVHGARCVGHGLCAEACPTGGIVVSLGDLSNRRDIPVLTEELQSAPDSGLFLAGEVTGFALIRTAIAHGTAAADAVARRLRGTGARPATRNRATVTVPPDAASHPAGQDAPLDLCIVGAGPAGLACALRARELGLCFAVLERDEIGGTVARYPRRKLVMTQPVRLPLHGELRESSYTKEELMLLWSEIVERHELPIVTGTELTGVDRSPGEGYLVRTSRGTWAARNVVLALGRRGTPRRLGVPGENLPKVAYGLLDAASYTGRRILVVGGGDSAVEAAMGLAEQPGNQVLLSYRSAQFSRLRPRNLTRLKEVASRGQLEILLRSGVRQIGEDRVELSFQDEQGARHTRTEPNDEVFILAGGIPPFPLLEQAGVSFDPAQRPSAVSLPPTRTSGLLPALASALAVALLAGGWILWHHDYYNLPLPLRPLSGSHHALRPGGVLGVTLGLGAVGLMAANLSYLLRRSRVGDRLPGSLRAWMTSHVATGLLALVLVLVHGAMAPRRSLGGYAFVTLVAVAAAGIVGRYLYSFVPRAANGRELRLEEVLSRLSAVSGEWNREGSAFGERVRSSIETVVDRARFGTSFPSRIAGLFREGRELRHLLARLRSDGIAEGLPRAWLGEILDMARRAHQLALSAAHYGDLRAVLHTWRWLHRWLALLLVLLTAWHVATAWRFADLDWLRGLLGGGSR